VTRFRYLFVWDRQTESVVASAFVPLGPIPNEDLPKDTSHGLVRREDEDSFLAQLGRQFPGDRYIWAGGTGPNLARAVEGFFALELDTDHF
jgi:hypothetical protein